MNKDSQTTAGIYIHFPFCKVKCGYCDFYSIADRHDSIPEFVDSIIKELKLYFQLNDIDPSPVLWHTKYMSLSIKDLKDIIN